MGKVGRPVGTLGRATFTEREREIIKLVAEGLTNEAMATRLFIDIKTVEHHLNSIYSIIKATQDMRGKHLRVTLARMILVPQYNPKVIEKLRELKTFLESITSLLDYNKR